MSATCELTVPPAASTERGVPCSIDAWTSYLAYPAGNNVVLYNLEDEKNVVIYKEHGSKAVSCVKFSPNGAYVASGD